MTMRAISETTPVRLGIALFVSVLVGVGGTVAAAYTARDNLKREIQAEAKETLKAYPTREELLQILEPRMTRMETNLERLLELQRRQR